MNKTESATTTNALSVERDEIALIIASLNEVCNGVAISHQDFETRLGFTREEARGLLTRMQAIYIQRGP